jgi:hypothetical protein
MKSLEICRVSDEWYVALEGTFVVGFVGREAEQQAREQLSRLERLLDLHSDVSIVSSDEVTDRDLRIPNAALRLRPRELADAGGGER